VRLWDTRSPTLPVHSINSEFRNGLANVSWCPVKRNLICASGKDSSSLKLWVFKVNLGNLW
jgi:hypothetical protein